MGNGSRNPSRRPFVVAVSGLKNSGKTTVAQALISGLSARGYRVAAIKTSHLATLDLDPGGRDSRQLYDAGALCVVAQAQNETLVVQRHDRPAAFAELLRLLPPETDFLVAEGGVPAQADMVLLCLRTLEELEETLTVRRVPPEKVRAQTGLAAARAGPAGERDAAARRALDCPLLDAGAPEGREALTRLVLAAADCPEAAEA
jgi:molybdopterin-guanine dinucleotide biosynthesis protein MobB